MLSIITITMNDFDGLRRTLESTDRLRAHGMHVEQLVVDGSDDLEAKQKEAYCSTKTNVRYFPRPAKGISDAFNFAIQQTAYSWLWFMNGGDKFYDKADEAFFLQLLSMVKADLVVFQVELMSNHSVAQFPPMSKMLPPVVPWIPHPSTIVKKSLLEKHGNFSLKYKIAMDYDFWLRLSPENVVINIVSMPIASFDGTGISSTNTALVNKEGKEVLTLHRFKLFKSWLISGRNMLRQYRRFSSN